MRIKNTLIHIHNTTDKESGQTTSMVLSVYDNRYPKSLGFTRELPEEALNDPNLTLAEMGRVFIEIAKRHKEVDPAGLDNEIKFIENYLESLKRKSTSLMTQEGEIELM